MTTPQETLRDLEYNIRSLVRLLSGTPDDEGERVDIYEMCKAIEIETTEFNERMELLEDKMNIIIKLLGKADG